MIVVPLRRPRAHQAEALDFVRPKAAAALLMAMRTGKSKVIVDEWIEDAGSQGTGRDLLVVAPAGAYLTWGDALVEDVPPFYMAQSMVLAWDSGTAGTRTSQDDQAAFLAFAGPRVLLVNVEALSVVKAARVLCQRFVSQRCTLVVDESVVIKNRDSKASKFVVKTLGPAAGKRRILTGLVSPQGPLDVYAQYRFLDPRIFPETFDVFRSRYAHVRRVCVLPDRVVRAKYRSATKKDAPEDMTRSDMVEAIFAAGRYVQSYSVVEGYKNVDEIHQRIAPYSFRVRLEDCYDMPESTYTFLDVEATPEQARAYAEMREYSRAQLGGQWMGAEAVVSQMLQMHRILCGYVIGEDKDPIEIPEKRTAALVQFLEDYDGQAIVWCAYDEDVRRVSRALVRAYGDKEVARFWGGNRGTREAEEALFKEGRSRFMVGTAAAGGRGRDWSCADLVVYYSQANNLDHRAQSEERAKAVGKARSVAYVDMRVRGTVEDLIIDALRKKLDLASLVAGDPEPARWLI